MTDLNKASQEFWLTQAQYDTRKNAGTLVVGAIYHITDVSYENTSNKVTSISSSSTDTQYPSAKCVYDEVSSLKQDKVDKPTAQTPANYVPTSNGQGGYTWSAQQGGGGFPASPTAGDAVVYDGTSWAKQSGYGYLGRNTQYNNTFNVNEESLEEGFYNTEVQWLNEIVVGDTYKVIINGIEHEIVAERLYGEAQLICDGDLLEEDFTFALVCVNGECFFMTAESYGTSFLLKLIHNGIAKIDNKYIDFSDVAIPIMVTITEDESGNYTADKEYSELRTAIENGNPVSCKIPADDTIPDDIILTNGSLVGGPGTSGRDTFIHFTSCPLYIDWTFLPAVYLVQINDRNSIVVSKFYLAETEIVTVTENGSGGYSADKTELTLRVALQQGANVVCKFGLSDILANPIRISSGIRFTKCTTSNDGNLVFQFVDINVNGTVQVTTKTVIAT